tara:strand:+ start:394 stop:522 length:129 start_codon:yes stop_codon:yes gene_type:complete
LEESTRLRGVCLLDKAAIGAVQRALNVLTPEQRQQVLDAVCA